MFCPRCSQEQVSEETKFCSRCGFPLGLVAEILLHGGFLPQLAVLQKGKKLFTRRNGLFFALFWFMIFAMILTPIWAAADVEELAAICAVLGTVGGMIFVISSFAFLKKEPKNTENFTQELPNRETQNLYQPQHTALPPQKTQPAQNYTSPANPWKAPDTGSLVQPHSVTDNTTKLLEKDK